MTRIRGSLRGRFPETARTWSPLTLPIPGVSERTRQRKRNPCLPLWNCVTLGKELGYSRQTMLSDIEHMIDKGYPIAKDTSLKGYYYTQSFTPRLAQVIN